jgi:hypothetical protein
MSLAVISFDQGFHSVCFSKNLSKFHAGFILLSKFLIKAILFYLAFSSEAFDCGDFQFKMLFVYYQRLGYFLRNFSKNLVIAYLLVGEKI